MPINGMSSQFGPVMPGAAGYGTNPYSSLSNAITGLSNINPNVNFSGFQPYQPSSGFTDTSQAYQAKDYSGALPGYDSIRNRIKSQFSQAQDQAQDQINRQFAAAGGGPGNGAYTKQTENLASSMAGEQDQAQQGVDFQEAQQRQQLQQAEENKVFQSQEAQKQRQFQAGLTQAQTREGEQYQSYMANQEAMLQNTQQNASRQLQMAGLNIDANSKLASIDQAYQQQQMDKWNSAFNAAIEMQKNGLYPSGANFNDVMNDFMSGGSRLAAYNSSSNIGPFGQRLKGY